MLLLPQSGTSGHPAHINTGLKLDDFFALQALTTVFLYTSGLTGLWESRGNTSTSKLSPRCHLRSTVKMHSCTETSHESSQGRAGNVQALRSIRREVPQGRAGLEPRVVQAGVRLPPG